MSEQLVIRDERSDDVATISRIHEDAFETQAEARLVELLRNELAVRVSLVAQLGGAVVGHVLFTPVTLAGRADPLVLALGPVAVASSYRRQGIGQQLCRSGIQRCRELGVAGVVVLGHPEYYPRFGFVPSTRFGVDSDYDVPPEVFMALELTPGAFADGGRIEYHPLFRSV